MQVPIPPTGAFNLTFGEVLTIILVLGQGIATWVKFDSRVTTLENHVADLRNPPTFLQHDPPPRSRAAGA